MDIDIRKQIFTKNECYILNSSKIMEPIGIVVHSTGANNPSLKRYVGPDDGVLGKNQYDNHWNQFRPSGRQICCHGFIGKDKDGKIRIYQTLPWTCKGWHVGSGKKGSANNGYIGFEICEDNTNNKDYCLSTYKKAVELCAYLMLEYPTIKNANIIGHYEAAAKGLGSNHGDPQHWWKKHGLSMAQFRKDVKAKVEANTKPAPAPKPEPTPAPVGVAEIWRVEAGASIMKEVPKELDKAGSFTIVEKQGNYGRLKSGAGWIDLRQAKKR